jgi:hypothetical protein
VSDLGEMVISPTNGEEARRRDRTMMAVAITGSLLVHSSLFLVILVAHLLGFEPSPTIEARPGPEPVGIIPAKLLRLGSEPDPKRLPDRIVPALPTAPDDGVPVSQKLEPPPPQKTKRQPRPINPVEDDKVRDVLSRIRAFGEVTDHHTTTGHPLGVPGGDVSDPALVQAGSLWARQLTRVLKEYITYPSFLTNAEIRRLQCKVKVAVGRDLIPRNATIEPQGKSRNRFFDQAVLDSFEQMRVKRVKLPRPPSALEESLFGPGLVINIHGRDLD